MGLKIIFSGTKIDISATNDNISATNNNISRTNIILAPLIFLIFDPNGTPYSCTFHFQYSLVPLPGSHSDCPDLCDC